MAVHIFFIFVYLFCKNVFYIDCATVNIILIFHCMLALGVAIYKSNDYINPLNIMYLSCALSSYGNLVILGNVSNPQSNLGYYVLLQFANDSAYIWAFGMTFIFIGYILFGKYSLPKIRVDIKKTTAEKAFLIVLFMSVFSPQIRSLTYSLGSITRVIGLVGSVAILFYARLWATTGENKFRNFAVALLLSETYNSLSNSVLREELILPSIVFFVGYFTGKGNIKYLFSYRLIPLLVIFYVFTFIFGTLGKSRGIGIRFSDILAKEYFSDNYDNSSHVYDAFEKKSTFIERSANISQLTNAVRLVNDNGIYEGSVSAPLVIALVPRILWPEKPQIVMGMWFASAIGQGTALENGKNSNSINMTIPGECYLDFGYAGIVIGCIFFGAIIVLLWNSLDFFSSPYNITGMLFGGFILTVAMIVAADFQILITYTSSYLIFYIVKKIVNQ